MPETCGTEDPVSQGGEAVGIPLKSTLDAVQMVQPFLKEVTNLEVSNGTMNDVFLRVAGEKEERV